MFTRGDVSRWAVKAARKSGGPVTAEEIRRQERIIGARIRAAQAEEYNRSRGKS